MAGMRLWREPVGKDGLERERCGRRGVEKGEKRRGRRVFAGGAGELREENGGNALRGGGGELERADAG